MTYFLEEPTSGQVLAIIIFFWYLNCKCVVSSVSFLLFVYINILIYLVPYILYRTTGRAKGNALGGDFCLVNMNFMDSETTTICRTDAALSVVECFCKIQPNNPNWTKLGHVFK